MNYEEIKKEILKYPDAMTDSERNSRYAAGEEVDRIPFSIQSNEEAMAEIFGYTTADWRNDPDAHVDIIRRRKEEFGISGLYTGLRLRTLAQAVGTKIYFPEVGIDRIEKPVLTDFSGLPALLKENPYKNPLFLSLIERGKILKEAFPDMPISTSVAGPVTNVSCIMPIEQMLRDFIRHPEEVKSLLAFTVEMNLAWAEMFRAAFGPSACNIADPVSCADILGKKHYRKYSEPYLKELIEGLTKILGSKPSLHICGKTSPLWKEMAVLEISSFSVDNLESLSMAREVLGPTFGLVGNVNPVDVMLNGTPEEVLETCRKCIAEGAESPNGYTLATGCQIPIGTPKENILAFILAAKKYGRGARKGHLPRGITEA